MHCIFVSNKIQWINFYSSDFIFFDVLNASNTARYIALTYSIVNFFFNAPLLYLLIQLEFECHNRILINRFSHIFYLTIANILMFSIKRLLILTSWKTFWSWAVLVAQLAWWWLQVQEIGGVNPVISKFYLQSTELKTVLKRWTERESPNFKFHFFASTGW